MTIVKIYYTSLFVRNFKKLSREKQKQTIKKEKLFKQNPFNPSLKTHKLTGKLEGYWAFSITYQDRVIFRFVNKKEVIFFRIGAHAIYKN